LEPDVKATEEATQSPRGHRPLLPLENSSRTMHGLCRYPVQCGRHFAAEGLEAFVLTPRSGLAEPGWDLS